MQRRALIAASLLAPLTARAQEPRPEGQLPPGRRLALLARWGDRVTPDAPAFDPGARDAAAAEAQFGRDSRVVGLIPAPAASDGIPRATLAVIHPWQRHADPALAGAIQGASLLNIERQGSAWVVVDGGYQSRRLTATSLTRREDGTGTAGVVGLTGGAVTPWGSLLLCAGEGRAAAAALGLDPTAQGAILELDPLDPTSIPIRRAGLTPPGAAGALAAGGEWASACAPGLARDGRAVVFFLAGGRLWRFLSAADAHALDTLERGDLTLARVEGERLRWAPPASGAEAGFAALALAPNGSRLFAARGAGPDLVVEIGFARGDPAAETATVLPLLPSRPTPAPAAGPPPSPAYPALPVALGILPGGALLLGAAPANIFTPGGYWEVPVEGPDRGEARPLWLLPTGSLGGGGAAAPDGAALFLGFSPPEPRDLSVTGTWPDFSARMPPRGGVAVLSRAN